LQLHCRNISVDHRLPIGQGLKLMQDSIGKFDVLIVGGGVNGTGIARDASGRGLSVILCEKDDLASGTSSKATKLFHGGLRYLEHYEFGLVRKALKEREVLLRNMPHIARPMRFILPHVKGMRPAWLLRIGLFIYDHLGGHRMLQGTKVLDLRTDEAGRPLKPHFRRAFEYSDGWVDDARLVVLNARDAADRGARIVTRTRLVNARRNGDHWVTTLEDASGRETQLHCRILVNAAGPWVNSVAEDALRQNDHDPIRLVRGSHIVVRKLFDHDRAYFFQNGDGRIVFALPYETDFTLIGTTDVDHTGATDAVVCTDAEQQYLCRAASEYFEHPVSVSDVVWSYAGLRPLDGDQGGKAAAASRDYHIHVGDQNGRAPLISIYGGKITTFRILAEQVVAEMAPYVGLNGLPWTDHSPLPGGDMAFDGLVDLVAKLQKRYDFLDERTVGRIARAYGTRAFDMLGSVGTAQDMGQDFGAGLSAREVRWLVECEWATTAEDIVWRRSKCGLRMSSEQIARLDVWLKEHRT